MWWKIIVGIGTIITLIGGLYTIDDRYAKCKELQTLQQNHSTDVKKLEDTNTSAVQSLEKKTVGVLEDFRKEQSRNFQLQRLDTLNDTYYKYKSLLKSYPGDKELQDDLTSIEMERNRIKDALKLP